MTCAGELEIRRKLFAMGNQQGQCTVCITGRRVAFVFSQRYPAYTVYTPYCVAICDLSGCAVFSDVTSQEARLKKKTYWTQNVCFEFLYNFCLKYFSFYEEMNEIWSKMHIGSWIKIDRLDVTCFIISLFNAQHVSGVNTSILRNLRLICWVISSVVLLWFDVCWCYGVVWLGWCGILMEAEASPIKRTLGS